MVVYARFCDDLEIVFNLPVFIVLFRIDKNSQH